MMSEVAMILEEKLQAIGNYETIEDALNNGWKADYGRDINGNIYANWIKQYDMEKIK